MRLVPLAIACALLLTGCGQAGAPAPSASPTLDVGEALENGFWSVSGADEPASTRVRFGTVSVDVFRANGAVYGGLATRGDHLLTGFFGWSMSLGDDHEVPWLEAAATAERTTDGVRLLDQDGHEVAVLERADAPQPSKQYETDPTPYDPAPSPAPTPGAEAAAATAAALAGRWRLPDRSDAALVLTADGGWRAITTCPSGTGGGGGGGRFRVLAGGALLIVEGPVGGVGCSEPEHPSPDAPAIADFGRAGSLALDGDRLTVYDRAGAPLGTLVR